MARQVSALGLGLGFGRQNILFVYANSISASGTAVDTSRDSPPPAAADAVRSVLVVIMPAAL